MNDPIRAINDAFLISACWDITIVYSIVNEIKMAKINYYPNINMILHICIVIVIDLYDTNIKYDGDCQDDFVMIYTKNYTFNT
jgi:hypothetical protein